MKKVLSIILLMLLAVSPCLAEEMQLAKMVIGSGAAAPAACGAGTEIVCETFDGSSPCYSGDGTYNNCDVTWTLINTPNFDFKYRGDLDCTALFAPWSCCTGVGTGTCGTALDGTYSVATDGNASSGIVKSFTAQDPVYFFFLFRTPVFGSTEKIFRLLASDDTELMYIANVAPEFAIYCDDQMHYSTAMLINTTYCIWGDYTKGTGNNAVCHLYHVAISGSDCTKPGSPNITGTNGNSQLTASKIEMYMDNAGLWIYDHIRVGTSAFGSNPP